MSLLKVTKRMVDPITFQERARFDFLPRVEDCVMDAQLASSMAYHVSKPLPLAPPPPVDRSYRPPTPPKRRERGFNPNSPRESPSNSRSGSGRRRGSIDPSQLQILSPTARKRALELRNSLVIIAENDGMNEPSLSARGVLQASFNNLAPKEVHFADEIELNHFSRMSRSVLEEIFYASEDLANFRYEAFMEQAGLDVNDFD